MHNRHRRRSIRLPGYDYSQPGAYFVTICTQNRECVLDDPVVAAIIKDVWKALPSWFPTIDLDEFVVMPNHAHLVLWIYPPDVLADEDMAPEALGARGEADGVEGAGASPAPTESGEDEDGGINLVSTQPEAITRSWVIPKPEKVNLNPTLGEVIGAFKSLVFATYLDWIQVHDPTRRAKFWQRNYYEHVIRSDEELDAIRRYIRENPLQWALDRDNPQNLRHLPFPDKMEDYLSDIFQSPE